MAIKLDCPRCKQPLSVPNKKAGSYANCPRCQGRFWVPKDAPADAAEIEAVTLAAAVAASASPPAHVPAATFTPGALPAAPSTPIPSVNPPAAPPIAGRPVRPPTPPMRIAPLSPAASGLHPAAPAPVASAPAVPAPAAPGPLMPNRKVARFVAAEAAQSTIKPAADGRLPDLCLQEGQAKQKEEGKSTTINPLVLFGVLSLSVVLSVVLVLIDTEPQSSASEQKARARKIIEEKYFGGGTLEGGKVQPYQAYLRNAQQAHSRGDVKAEREFYRKVLDLLRTDPGASDPGAGPGARRHFLTGAYKTDEELEEQVRILLRESE
jgi:hypothetical protein